jgi:hypothetical protein
VKERSHARFAQNPKRAKEGEMIDPLPSAAMIKQRLEANFTDLRRAFA